MLAIQKSSLFLEIILEIIFIRKKSKRNIFQLKLFERQLFVGQNCPQCDIYACNYFFIIKLQFGVIGFVIENKRDVYLHLQRSQEVIQPLSVQWRK